MVGPATDTYAIACVLYEMLVGEPPYLGNTAQAVLGKIISGDAVSAAKGPASRLSLVATAIVALLAGAAGWSLLAPSPPVTVSRYAIELPDGHDPTRDFGSNITISPDGSRMVYLGPSASGGAGGQQLWMRRRDQLEPTPLPGTEGAMSPTFAPDGRRVAFVVGNTARVVSLGGEPPLTVADNGVGGFGLTWGEDGFIYVDHDEVLGRVPDTGGDVERVSQLDTLTAEMDHGWPQALPGGRGVLFTVFHSPTGDVSQYDLAVLDLESGDHRVLVRGVFGRYSPSGHLLYVSADGTLLAAPFDLGALEVTGPAVAIVEGVGVQGFGSLELAVSDDGTLVHVTGIVSSGLERAAWVT
jgi:serine/threonine-protein kinase